jgi:hypothetical protein
MFTGVGQMKRSKTHVVSLRMPVSEFIALAGEAEQKNTSVSEILLRTWRERNTHASLETRLQQIELALAELRGENAHKFQRVADGLNQIILGRK